MQRGYMGVFVIVLMALLLGCTSPSVVKLPDASAAPYSTGYLVPSKLGYGYYFTVSKQGSQWVVLDISLGKKPVRKTPDEIIFVGSSGQHIQPAFDWEGRGEVFGCSAIWQKGLNYSPCRDTALATTDIASSALANLILVPLSAGLYAGTNRSVEVKVLGEIVDQTKMLATIDRINVAWAAAENDRSKLLSEHTKIANAARSDLAINVEIQDQTKVFELADSKKLSNLVRKNLPAAPDVLSQPKTLSEFVSGDLNRTLSNIQEFRAGMLSIQRESLSKLAVGVECSTQQWSIFSVSLSCPTVVGAPNGIPVAGVKVIASIVAANFGTVYPRFSIKDSSLLLESDKGKIWLTNLSSTRHLDIGSVSVYYNKEISTKTFTPPISLPPDSKTKTPIDIVSIAGDDLNRVARIDAFKASMGKTEVKFGFAAKYGQNGEVQNKSLYKTVSTTLEQIIADR